MNPASVDVKDMLVASGLGLVFSKNLFVGKEPVSPPDCVTIYDTPSMQPDLTLDKTETYYRSSVQVRVRNTKYLDGMELSRYIMDALHGRAHETWGDSLYTVIRAMGEPAAMAWDDNNRIIFIINFNLQRR